MTLELATSERFQLICATRTMRELEI